MNYKLNLNYKKIFDTIHKNIKISNLACHFIDTEQFQRLRGLHQLGTCHYVYPCATHSRFEHSIGVYHLAGRLCNCIINNTHQDDIDKYLQKIPYLQNYFNRRSLRYKQKTVKCVMDDYIVELIKIAGLCHDIGHGPFSHVFDDSFIPAAKLFKKKNGNNIVDSKFDEHENRSCFIIDYIIKNDPILSKVIHKDEINFIKSLISPSKNENGFIYQIISNNLNGIDVDKFDYLKRDTYILNLEYSFDFSRLVDDIYVIDDKICYPKQMNQHVYNLFNTRYILHKNVYGHKVVVATQFMINDILLLVDPIINILESINNVISFCTLTDEYVISIVDFLLKMDNISDNHKNRLIKANNIMKRLKKRDLYVFIGDIVSPDKIDLTWENFNLLDDTLSKDDILIYKSKRGYVSGSKKNPLDDIYFYNSKITFPKSKTNKCFKNISDRNFMPNIYQEYIVKIYSKINTKDKLVRIKNCFDVITKHNITNKSDKLDILNEPIID